MITPIAFDSIKYQTYIIFAVINFAMIPSVYFFYPETAYRSLEEMDSIFEKLKPGWAGALQAVHQAEVEPRRYGKNGEVLIDYADTEAGRDHGRRGRGEARGAVLGEDEKAGGGREKSSGGSADGVSAQHDEEKRT